MLKITKLDNGLRVVTQNMRVYKNHMTPDRHFGLEAAAWYWHFVDVVWLGLFIFVYWI